jgi:diacylglycerol kinase (ATP)
VVDGSGPSLLQECGLERGFGELAEVTETLSAVETESPRWVLIQRNPTAGSGCRRRTLHQFVQRLRELGFHPRLFDQRSDLDRFLTSPGRQSDVWCAVAAGGDGTIRDLHTRFPQLRLGILPLGTENVLAKSLQLPRSGRALADVVAAGVTRSIDVGAVGSQRFLFALGVGLDAEVVDRVHRRRTGHLSKLHYVGPTVAVCCRGRQPRFTVAACDAVTGVRLEQTGFQLIVSNIPRYGLGLQFSPDAADDDGRLDLKLFSQWNWPTLARVLWWAGRHAWPDDAIQRSWEISSARVTELQVTSDTPLPVQADGDPLGSTPIHIRVLRQSCQLLVPPEHSSAARADATDSPVAQRATGVTV